MDYTQAKIIGPYTTGEVPFPLVVTMRDVDGNALDFSVGGPWQSKFEILNRGTGVLLPERNAVIAPDQVNNKGQVTYTWVAADFADAGEYQAELWVGNGSQKIASLKFAWHTRLALRVPAI